MGQPEAEGGGVSHTGMCAVSFTRTDRYCTVPYVRYGIYHTGSQDIVKYNKITIQYVLSLFIHRDAVRYLPYRYDTYCTGTYLTKCQYHSTH